MSLFIPYARLPCNIPNAAESKLYDSHTTTNMTKICELAHTRILYGHIRHKTYCVIHSHHSETTLYTQYTYDNRPSTTKWLHKNGTFPGYKPPYVMEGCENSSYFTPQTPSHDILINAHVQNTKIKPVCSVIRSTSYLPFINFSQNLPFSPRPPSVT